jgi:hypothetical protein
MNPKDARDKAASIKEPRDPNTKAVARLHDQVRRRRVRAWVEAKREQPRVRRDRARALAATIGRLSESSEQN